jgi:hypothetical protein
VHSGRSLSRTEHGESGPDEVTGVTGEQAEVAVVRDVSLRAAARSALTR